MARFPHSLFEKKNYFGTYIHSQSTSTNNALPNPEQPRRRQQRPFQQSPAVPRRKLACSAAPDRPGTAQRGPPHWVSGPATRCPSEARLSPPPSHRGPQMRKPLAVPLQRPRSIDVRPWPIWTAPTRSKGPLGSVAVLSSSLSPHFSLFFP